MLLIIGAALGLLAGLLTGGSLGNLVARRLRWPVIVLAAFAVKELEMRSPLGTTAAAPAVYVVSLLVLIAWTLWHRDELPGVWLVSLGMFLNLVAIVANGGRMPVVVAAAHLGPPQLREQGHWAQYVLMGPDTRLAFLGDWILMPWPLSWIAPQAYSVGDLVSTVGLAVVLFLATRPRHATRPQGVITTR